MKKMILLTLLLLPLAGYTADQNSSPDQTYRMSRSIDHGSVSNQDLDAQLNTKDFDIQAPISTTPLSRSRALSSYADSGLYWIYVYDTEVSLDYDHDGFYQRFTLSFEPEVAQGYDQVYADIYLSYEGNTWDYLTSTDVHNISANTTGQTINVTTVLDYGYPAGYYDALIEIRDAYTDALLVSVGPDSEGTLTAIPLEDDYRDGADYHYGVGVDYYVHGTGSLGLGGLLMTSGLLGFRRITRTLQF